MKRWAVSFVSFHDNDLTTVIVEGPTWYDALCKHPKAATYEYKHESLDTAKQDFFDADAIIEVVEVPKR